MKSYTPDMVIRNVESLPKGGGCKFLLCIHGQGNDLVAKSWHRKAPVAGRGEVVVVFGSLVKKIN